MGEEWVGYPLHRRTIGLKGDRERLREHRVTEGVQQRCKLGSTDFGSPELFPFFPRILVGLVGPKSVAVLWKLSPLRHHPVSTVTTGPIAKVNITTIMVKVVLLKVLPQRSSHISGGAVCQSHRHRQGRKGSLYNKRQYSFPQRFLMDSKLWRAHSPLCN